MQQWHFSLLRKVWRHQEEKLSIVVKLKNSLLTYVDILFEFKSLQRFFGRINFWICNDGATPKEAVSRFACIFTEKLIPHFLIKGGFPDVSDYILRQLSIVYYVWYLCRKRKSNCCKNATVGAIMWNNFFSCSFILSLFATRKVNLIW